MTRTVGLPQKTRDEAPLEVITPRWTRCVVAASGPSLTSDVAEMCRGQNVIAVNDAYRLLPFADVLYACDAKWWDVHEGCPGFEGERWSSHSSGTDDKLATAKKYGLRLVAGAHREGFSFEPSVIHYGSNSGFQAVNLAVLFGLFSHGARRGQLATQIILVGFDMRVVDGKRHFFGDHPPPLTNAARFETFIPQFERAAKMLPEDIEIVNCTPGSALCCFRMARLEDTL